MLGCSERQGGALGRRGPRTGDAEPWGSSHWGHQGCSPLGQPTQFNYRDTQDADTQCRGHSFLRDPTQRTQGTPRHPTQGTLRPLNPGHPTQETLRPPGTPRRGHQGPRAPHAGDPQTPGTPRRGHRAPRGRSPHPSHPSTAHGAVPSEDPGAPGAPDTGTAPAQPPRGGPAALQAPHRARSGAVPL